MRTRLVFSAVLVASGVAACGGGGTGGDRAPAQGGYAVPASAMASPEAFTRFVGAIRADDHARPLEVDALRPPVSETTRPIDAI